MSKRMKKGIFWGALIAVFAFVINALHHAFEGSRQFGRGRGHGKMMAQQGGPGQGQGRMLTGQGGFGKRGGFEPHQFAHHGGEFHWLGALFFLVMVVVVLVFLVKWLRRRKAKSASMVHFNSTPELDLQTPVVNPNATILDQWEKELMKKKENE